VRELNLTEPDMSDLAFSTLTQLAQGLSTKKYSSEELAREYLTRISKGNKKLHAYVLVDEDSTIAQARAADQRRAAGYSLSAVDGVPIAVKDLCDIEGQITTGGSQDWVNRRSPTTCTAVALEPLGSQHPSHTRWLLQWLWCCGRGGSMPSGIGL
jgi:aspartyl-tRNA(Asn)/glutamyl-tRNA(Gln) amidotransferase subunit A